MILEGVVTEHERDGRAWKAEWVAFPEVCLLTATALQFAHKILAGLEVDEAAMARNLSGWDLSEKVLSLLSPVLGKHAAQAALQEALAEGRRNGLSLQEALNGSEQLRPHLGGLDFAAPDPGLCPQMVAEVVARARRARANEPEEWPIDDGKESDCA